MLRKQKQSTVFILLEKNNPFISSVLCKNRAKSVNITISTWNFKTRRNLAKVSVGLF